MSPAKLSPVLSQSNHLHTDALTESKTKPNHTPQTTPTYPGGWRRSRTEAKSYHKSRNSGRSLSREASMRRSWPRRPWRKSSRCLIRRHRRRRSWRRVLRRRRRISDDGKTKEEEVTRSLALHEHSVHSEGKERQCTMLHAAEAPWSSRRVSIIFATGTSCLACDASSSTLPSQPSPSDSRWSNSRGSTLSSPSRNHTKDAYLVYTSRLLQQLRHLSHVESVMPFVPYMAVATGNCTV